MKKTKKLFALCLCSTVAATNISPMTTEAVANPKTTVEEVSVFSVLADKMVTPLASKIQTQNVQAMATSSDGFVYDTNGVSTITITGYTGSASDLVIPDVIDGYTVTKIAGSVFKGNTRLNTVVLPSTIISIGEDAFYKCTNLKTIDIPDTVTTIGNYAFSGCTSLSSVELSSSLITLGCEAFSNCTALSSIVIPKTLTTYTSVLDGPFEGVRICIQQQ